MFEATQRRRQRLWNPSTTFNSLDCLPPRHRRRGGARIPVRGCITRRAESVLAWLCLRRITTSTSWSTTLLLMLASEAMRFWDGIRDFAGQRTSSCSSTRWWILALEPAGSRSKQVSTHSSCLATPAALRCSPRIKARPPYRPWRPSTPGH